MENFPQRKQLRLRNYDYAQAGYYFVTLCAKDKVNLFGKIIAGDAEEPVLPNKMQENHIGKIVIECWNRINEIYDNVKTDAFCLMPNHMHGIIVITETGGQGRPPLRKIIQRFKSVTSRMCFRYKYTTIWQRNYYEHVICNEHELQKTREYIIGNPAKWHEDKYYV